MKTVIRQYLQRIPAPGAKAIATLRLTGLICFFSVNIAAALASPALSLERMFTGPDAWRRTPQDFERDFAAHGMSWLSAEKDRARFAGDRLSLWNGAVRPVEIVAVFENEKPSAIEISIYNRADSRQHFPDETSFLAFVENQKSAVERGLAIRAVTRPHDDAAPVPIQGWRFHNSSLDASLESGMRRANRARGESFQSEFLRLRVAPSRSGSAFAPMPGSRAGGVFAPESRVQRQADGSVWIPGVPMVDQGPKGYCVVASVERVMRFHGIAVDQHDLARLAGSDAAAGTSPDRMLDELRQKQARLQIRVRDLYRLEEADAQRLIRSYNGIATRGGGKPLPTSDNLPASALLFLAPDPGILLDLRVKRNPAEYQQFLQQIRQHIDRGVPLLWGVRLGVFPEPNLPQAGGGHMRLIIGYDERREQLIYSDSWGAEHASKHMPMDRAWTITTRLAVIDR